MMRQQILLISFSFFCFASFAQTKLTGTWLNSTTKVHANFNFVKSESRKDSLYITHYSFTDSLNVACGEANVSFDKQKKLITVTLDLKSGTIFSKCNYTVKYSDSLGLVFGTKSSFKKDPPAKSDLVIAFTNSSKTYLKISQISSNNSPALNYSLEKISSDEIAANVKLLTPPPPPVIIKSPSFVKEFIVDSINVILKPSSNELVTVSVFFDGGTSNYPSAKEGIEAMAIDMAVNGGTKTMTASEINNQLEVNASTLSYDCKPDYSSISISGLVEDFDSNWQLLSDIITKPLMSADAFNNCKQKFISTLQENKQDPLFKLNSSSMGTVFMTKNYDKYIFGSDYSLSKITIEDVKKFFSLLTSRNKCTIVICGNISQTDITSKIKTGLKSLITSPSTNLVPSGIDISTSTMNYYAGDGNTNYLEAIAGAPAINSNDYISYLIAIHILQNQLQNELEVNRNLSSSTKIYTAGQMQNYTILTLNSSDPNKAVQLIIDQLKTVRKIGFTIDEFNEAKDQILSDIFINQQSNLDQTLFLGNAEMLGGWQLADKLNDDIQNTTLTDANSSIKKYLKAFKFFYAGDKESANEIIFTQKID